MWNSAENVFARSSSFKEDGEDEEALRWAALERLPTYDRVRRGIFRNIVGDSKEIDLSKLESQELKLVLERLASSVEDDTERFFDRMRRRFDTVDLEFPKIEVRFQHLVVESFVHVGSRALPTIPNFIRNMTEAFLRQLRLYPGKRKKLTILDDISGIIRPSRLTLLLGPPSSGKTTLMLALAGRLGSDLQMSGRITYNGHNLYEFVPEKTSAYVSQQDCHVAEMTVRETLEFSGRCQGVGSKYDMLMELSRREKMAGIKPDEDLDIFMKVIDYYNKRSIVAQLMLRNPQKRSQLKFKRRFLDENKEELKAEVEVLSNPKDSDNDKEGVVTIITIQTLDHPVTFEQNGEGLDEKFWVAISIYNQIPYLDRLPKNVLSKAALSAARRDFSSYEKQIARWIKQITGTKECQA